MQNNFERNNRIIPCCSEYECLLWWFFHNNAGAITYYESVNDLYCSCLDCCATCLQLRFNKNRLCKKETTCFLCCCSIVFI